MTFCLPLAYWLEYKEKKKRGRMGEGDAAEALLEQVW
jgi:hypothetical protein